MARRRRRTTEKVPRRTRIRAACVRVTDRRREELQKAHTGSLASGRDGMFEDTARERGEAERTGLTALLAAGPAISSAAHYNSRSSGQSVGVATLTASGSVMCCISRAMERTSCAPGLRLVIVFVVWEEWDGPVEYARAGTGSLSADQRSRT